MVKNPLSAKKLNNVDSSRGRTRSHKYELDRRLFWGGGIRALVALSFVDGYERWNRVGYSSLQIYSKDERFNSCVQVLHGNGAGFIQT